MYKPNIKVALVFALAIGILASTDVTAAASLSQQKENQHDKHQAQPGDKWAEMDAFHSVMSQTFHPAEEGKLEPIRKRAGEMATKAKQWSDSKPPKIYDVPEIKEMLVKLAAESKALADNIARGAGDDQVKKELTALHDRFHEIVGACHAEKKKHQ
jgi:hypothetical protein